MYGQETSRGSSNAAVKTISQIETPALILDQHVMEDNMRRMDAMLENTGMKLYPHYKSHKCPQLANMQIQHGAAGITCAKLSEAEDLSAAGIGTIVLANQVVQSEKLTRMAALAGRCHLTVCTDSAENILALERAAAAAGTTLYVLVELEVGMRRCGVSSPEEFLDLAKRIAAQPHLVFEGIQAYAGHLAHETNAAVRHREMQEIEQKVKDLKEFVQQNGLPVRAVCGGSTGTVADKPKNTVYTQLQAGSYLFMDCAYERLDLTFRPALFLLTSIISVRPDWIVTDSGVKSLSMDQVPPRFLELPQVEYSLSEEHTTLFTPSGDWKTGDHLRCIPGHCCTTINMADQIYLVDGADVIDVLPVVSRGKAQ